ncbi:MAG TPA: GNAT family N-acetyltransferase [Acidimicrobiales bacterium]|nr:GNAT family N-acetyltransferase [Acidimicrobiales bacterium]
MSIEVRRIEQGEVRPWLATMAANFFQRPPERHVEWWERRIEPGRTWAAVEGARVVGTLRSFLLEITVPGPAAVPACAVTNVTVSPTHRRRGLLNEMLRAELAASVEREEPLSILIASEWPIYGRYGYGVATESATYEVDSRRARFLAPRRGSVELVDGDVLCKVAPPIYDRYRLARPGAISRRDWWWERLRIADAPGSDEPLLRHALYRGESGEADGFASYHVKNNWVAGESLARVAVRDFVAATSEAWLQLWRFCCSIDLAVEVHADRPVDEPLSLVLEDGRAARQAHRHDFVWARPLDVPTALTRRSYLGEGSVVVAVADPLGYAAGTYRLEAGPDGASCSRTSESPELSLGVDSLGSLYLGGVAAPALALAGRIDEHRPGALETASRLFATPRPPWCATSF